MTAVAPTLTLFEELRHYKQKYYTNQLLKGLLIASAILLSTYISFNFLEYLGRFGSGIRAFLFFSFLLATFLVVFYWILMPASKLLGLNRPLSDEEAARQIGQHFPEIDDKLLNTIQLHKATGVSQDLVRASIMQKSASLRLVKFTEAIRYSDNRKYARLVLIPLLVLGGIFLLAPGLFTELFTRSSARIIQFGRDFAEPAPFQFELKNEKLQAFKNEDFTVQLRVAGRAIPSEVYLVSGGRRYKMTAGVLGEFSYLFPKLQKPVSFRFEAAGFGSDSYQIALVERPSLLSFSANLVYPAYLGKANERWENIGNLVVPEGTRIQWQFRVNQSDKLQIIFNEGKDTVLAQKKEARLFEYNRQANRSQGYQVRLFNQYSTNKEEISYFINVVPDRFPKITMEAYEDTLTYNFLSVGGSISDDYGFSQLRLFYRVNREGKPGEFKGLPITIGKDQSIQNFYYQLDLSSLRLQPGDRLEYYTQIWDNDGVNGPKSAKTTAQELRVPTPEDLREEVDQSVAKTETQIDKSIRKAQQLQKEIKSLEDKLRNKNRLDYQDRKMAEEILKKREELAQELKKLQEQNQLLNQQQERFAEKSPEIKEKMEQLQKLMDDLLDEETKKLYEELQKLLEQKRDNDEVIQKLEEIKNREGALEKELDRALEMFKQLQFEQKLEQTITELEELAKEQEELAEQTENKEKSNEELRQEQQEIEKKFEQIQQELQELEEMDKDLESPNGMEENNEELQDEQQEIEEQMENSQEQLQKNQNKKAGQSQKNAGQKMKQMAQQLSEMEASMEMDQMMENMDDLRAILENLVQLSFDQEALMKEFRPINLSDPRFIKLAQQQLKLRDDAKIIEDSLTALSKRVFQIQSFVTRELEEMNQNMDESTELIKQRKLGNATAKQQFAMTAMNNLALMLSDVLNQMQNAMQNAMAMPQKGKGKPQKMPGLGKMQQELNERIQKLKESGKSGRELSEELAKLAAEQERIRQALRELEKLGNQGDPKAKEQLSKQLQELRQQMEETEEDLVNKRLDRITKKRQQDIETRLLESEKALRERGQEEERKAEQARKKEPTVPPALQQYLKNKEKQIELLKTVPPALSPYFKKEVDKYFEKIDN
ncbi:MAG: ATPase [Microscillaceae bacterium]